MSKRFDTQLNLSLGCQIFKSTLVVMAEAAAWVMTSIREVDEIVRMTRIWHQERQRQPIRIGRQRYNQQDVPHRRRPAVGATLYYSWHSNLCRYMRNSRTTLTGCRNGVWNLQNRHNFRVILIPGRRCRLYISWWLYSELSTTCGWMTRLTVTLVSALRLNVVVNGH